MKAFIPEEFAGAARGGRDMSPAAQKSGTEGFPTGEGEAGGSSGKRAWMRGFDEAETGGSDGRAAGAPGDYADTQSGEQKKSAADEIRRAKQKAMDLLLDMDRTEKGLRQKLERKGFSAAAVDAAVSYVKGYGYVDDVRYADHYIEVHSRSRSRQRIRYDLAQKGIDRGIIDAAFEKAGAPDERPLIRTLAEKRADKYDLSDPKSRMKLASYLSRQGFAASDIWAVIADMR